MATTVYMCGDHTLYILDRCMSSFELLIGHECFQTELPFNFQLFTWLFGLMLSFDQRILIRLKKHNPAGPTRLLDWCDHQTPLTNSPSSKGVIIELINFIFLFNQPIIFLLQSTVFIQGLRRKKTQCSGGQSEKANIAAPALIEVARKCWKQKTEWQPNPSDDHSTKYR